MTNLVRASGEIVSFEANSGSKAGVANQIGKEDSATGAGLGGRQQ